MGNVPDEIKNQWTIFKTAMDYLKFRRPNICTCQLIVGILDEVDYLFDMINIVTTTQNSCTHNILHSNDFSLRMTADLSMFECKICGRQFRANIPTPDEFGMAYEQLCEFIRAQVPQKSTPRIIIQPTPNHSPRLLEIYEPLELIRLEYLDMYEREVKHEE